MKSSGLFRGGTLDDALSKACTSLRSRVGELTYDVCEEENGSSEVVIEAGVDPVAVLGLFLSETFESGKLDISARLDTGEEGLEGELKGEDVRWLTGSGGRGLDALQYLCNRVINRRMAEHHPVHLDSEGFKLRRAEQLQDRAEDAAEEVLRRRAPVKIGPLTPAARREIHMALADDPDVETESDGEGFLKKVVIRPRRRS